MNNDPNTSRQKESGPLEKDLRDALENYYAMIKKTKLLAFLGGAVGFLVLVGIISWEVTIAAIKSEEGKLSLVAIQREAQEAERTGKHLKELKERAEANAAHPVDLIDLRLARHDQLAALNQQKASLKKQISEAKGAQGLFATAEKAKIPGLQKKLKAVEDQITELETEK
jgi:hypothetical protein